MIPKEHPRGPLTPVDAAAVKAARTGRGWSHDTTARHSGLPRQTIIRIEKGRTPTPRWDTVAAIARALGVAPDTLTIDR